MNYIFNKWGHKEFLCAEYTGYSGFYREFDELAEQCRGSRVYYK